MGKIINAVIIVILFAGMLLFAAMKYNEINNKVDKKDEIIIVKAQDNSKSQLSGNNKETKEEVSNEVNTDTETNIEETASVDDTNNVDMQSDVTLESTENQSETTEVQENTEVQPEETEETTESTEESTDDTNSDSEYNIIDTAILHASTSVNIRKGPSTDTDKVGKLEEGQEVMVNATTKDGIWCRIVDDNGAVQGFVMMEYLQQ